MGKGRFDRAQGMDALRRAVAEVLCADLGPRLVLAGGALPSGVPTAGPAWLLAEAAAPLHEIAPDPGPSDVPAPVGTVLVLTAGTSDGAVAAEVAATLTASGVGCRRVDDVGVAGVHRVLAVAPDLAEADAVVVVAGMDGALPSVVAGLTDRLVVAVPTSVGYGAAFEGLAALLTMLTACAPGVLVVNIDNGFGAGVAAARIARSAQR